MLESTLEREKAQYKVAMIEAKNLIRALGEKARDYKNEAMDLKVSIQESHDTHSL